MNSRRNRLTLQFRLRTLLTIVAVCAVLFAVLAVLYARQVRYHNSQLAAVEAIQNLGGQAYFDYQYYLKQVAPDSRERRFDREGSSFEQLFGKVCLVDLSGLKVTDDDLKCLRHLDGLEELDLSGTNVTGEFLAYLNTRVPLDILNLNDSDFDGAHLDLIPQSVGLLELNRTSLNDEQLSALRLPELIRIEVDGTDVTQQGVARFNKRHPNFDLSPSP